MTFTNLVIGIIAFVLLLIIVLQISKVGEMLRYSRSDQEEAEQESSNFIGISFLVTGILGMILIVWSYFSQSHKYLPSASSQLGRDWDHIFYKIFTPPIILVFFITQILLFYFTWKYRYRKGAKVLYFSHSNKLEMIWTSVPFITMIIFGAISIPKWVSATSAPSENALHIRVTGMQFKWFMAYPGPDGEFGKRDIREHGNITNLLGLDPEDEKGFDDIYVDELVVPVGQEISFDLSALDVIHDFYLPHFRMKLDCVPGVPTRMKIIPDVTTEEMRNRLGDPKFEYEIACAELCGTGHWNMRRTIKVVSQEEYNQWISEQMTAKELYYDAINAEITKQKQFEREAEHQIIEDKVSGDETNTEEQHNDEPENAGH